MSLNKLHTVLILQMDLFSRGLARTETIYYHRNVETNSDFILCARPSGLAFGDLTHLESLANVGNPLLSFLSELNAQLDMASRAWCGKSRSHNFRDMYELDSDKNPSKYNHDLAHAFVDALDLASRAVFRWSLQITTMKLVERCGVLGDKDRIEVARLIEHAEVMLENAKIVRARKNDLLALVSDHLL